MEPALDPPEDYWGKQPDIDEDFDFHDDIEPSERDIQEAENRWQTNIDDRW